MESKKQSGLITGVAEPSTGVNHRDPAGARVGGLSVGVRVAVRDRASALPGRRIERDSRSGSQ
jgi:hypothetical protein